MIDVVEVLADLWVNHLTLFIERLAVVPLPLATLDTLLKEFVHCNESPFSPSSDFPQSRSRRNVFDANPIGFVNHLTLLSTDGHACECVRVWQQLAIAFSSTDTQRNKQITFAQFARSAYLCLFDGPISHVCTNDYRDRILNKSNQMTMTIDANDDLQSTIQQEFKIIAEL